MRRSGVGQLDFSIHEKSQVHSSHSVLRCVSISLSFICNNVTSFAPTVAISACCEPGKIVPESALRYYDNSDVYSLLRCRKCPIKMFWHSEILFKMMKDGNKHTISQRPASRLPSDLQYVLLLLRCTVISGSIWLAFSMKSLQVFSLLTQMVYFEHSFWLLYPPLVKGEWFLRSFAALTISASQQNELQFLEHLNYGNKQYRCSRIRLSISRIKWWKKRWITESYHSVSLCIPGRYLVSGHHSYRASERRAAPLRAPSHEGFIPYPKEQPTHAGGQLQQTAQGVCWGLPQQRAQFCKYSLSLMKAGISSDLVKCPYG